MRKASILVRALFVAGVAGAAVVGSLAATADAAFPIGGLCGPRYCLDVWIPVICPNGQVYSNTCYAARACQTGCTPLNY